MSRAQLIPSLDHFLNHMKTAHLILSAIALGPLIAASGCASKAKPQPGERAPVTQSIPVQTTAQPAPTSAIVPSDNQQLYNAESIVLAPQQHASQIIEAFQPAYEKLSKPRFVIYVNRDLLGKTPATTKTSRAPSGQGTVITTNTLADKQTTRDIERISARPFRYAGATLADQPVATTLATSNLKSAEAREALKKVADVAIEVLVSSRTITVPQISGQNLTIAVPDIQMTAIRLTDAAIIGQATAADIIGQLPASALTSLNVQDVLESTALNLMSDITATTK